MKSFLSFILILCLVFVTCEKKPPTLEDVKKEYIESDNALPPNGDYPLYISRRDIDLLVEKKYSFDLPLTEIKSGNVTCECQPDASAHIYHDTKVMVVGSCRFFYRNITAHCTLRIRNSLLEGYSDIKMNEENYCGAGCFFGKIPPSHIPNEQERIYEQDIYKQIESSIAKERFCREKIKPAEETVR